MACELKPTCDFNLGLLQYSLLRDTIEVEIMVRTVQGIQPSERTLQQNHPPAALGAVGCNPSHLYVRRLRPFKKKRGCAIPQITDPTVYS